MGAKKLVMLTYVLYSKAASMFHARYSWKEEGVEKGGGGGGERTDD